MDGSRALGWRTPALVAAAVCVAAAAPVGTARAQGSPATGTVRGIVRSEGGEAVSYAVVALRPLFAERFSDDSGRFVFGSVPPGVYRLMVRQVGYRPLDTTVVAVAGRGAQVALSLERLAVRLAEVSVVRTSRCRTGGPPDSTGDTPLARVYGQLRLNAERYRLLADSYPVLYRMERTLGEVDSTGSSRVELVDSLDLRTNARARYVPGHVVGLSEDRREPNALQLNLPSLPDLADDAFQNAHCFYLAGLDTLDGTTLVRVDFVPAERLERPDVEGSVYLDTATYQVRHSIVRLRQAWRVMPGLTSVTASVSYREIVPGIILVGRVRARNSIARQFRNASGGGAHTEEQRLLAFRFLRPLPSGP